jgi:hypothetical protein
VSRLRVALVLLGDAMLVVALVLITQIDKLINETLYSFGLQFSLDWAQPYWFLLRVSMISIVAAILLISVVELPVPAFQERNEKPDEAEEEEQGEVAEEQVEEQSVGILEPESQEE